jgi:uncharacterized protein YjbI with pentapeptide repeats
VDLTSLNLAGLDLEGASLVNATLVGLDLSGTNLGKANLAGANINATQLAGANVNGARFGPTNGTPASLPAAYAVVTIPASNATPGNYLAGPGAYLYKVDFSGKDLSNVDLAGANMSWVLGGPRSVSLLLSDLIT